LDEKRKLKEMPTPDQSHAGSSPIPSRAFLRELVDDERRNSFVVDHIRTRLALLIRALREQNGWSQSELGRRLRKPQSVVSRLEDSGYKLSLQTLFEVAAAFRLPLYVDMPNWDEWFRLMEDMSSHNLKRQSFDLDHLVALANVSQNDDTSLTPIAAIQQVASAGTGILSGSESETGLGQHVLFGQQSGFGKTGSIAAGASPGGMIYSGQTIVGGSDRFTLPGWTGVVGAGTDATLAFEKSRRIFEPAGAETSPAIPGKLPSQQQTFEDQRSAA
jgi:transcriptional regulator with XRE-family HTH domain